MKSLRLSRTSRTGTWLIATVGLLAIGSAFAQRDRITQVLDNYRTVVVPGHQNPLAKAEFDRGAAPGNFPLRGMTLTVRRSAAQQKDLNQLLAAQQNPASPSYHKWLTPEQFASRFGASANDLTTLRQWLESQGFQIKAVAHSGTFIRFDATAAQVRNAFKTEIHRYSVAGVLHYANAGPPQLPTTLAPLVLAVGGMNDFGPHPFNVKHAMTQGGGKVSAHYIDGASNNDLAPGDLAAIYHIGPLYGGGYIGTGQTVVVIGASDVTSTDLTGYCTAFSLTCGTFTQTFPAGDSDPGIVPEWATEATMDLELVSAVAPAAQLVLDADGVSVWNALYDAVDLHLGEVILTSFGTCETGADSANASAIQSAVQAANVLGMTVISASGDAGGAGCDTGTLTSAGAEGTFAVTLPASIPEVTGVGGTEFNEGLGSYWGSSNSATGGTATGYIPEMAWSDTAANFTALNYTLAASGGGISGLFAVPSWQWDAMAGGRNVPDVALAASGVHDGYTIYMSGVLSTSATSPYTMGGTSASAPVFAGILALLNQAQGTGSGNINSGLYNIALGGNGAAAFHGITIGGNLVPCDPLSVSCPLSGSIGYPAGPGSTGLGSVDADELLHAWRSPTGSISSLTPSSATAGNSGLTLTVNGAAFVSGAVVEWNSAPLTTTFGSETQLTAPITMAMLASTGSASVTVLNGGAAASAPATFTITAAPAITSLTPSISTAGGTNPVNVTIAGTNFMPSSVVKLGTTTLSSWYSSPTALLATILPSSITTAGTPAVTVVSADGVSSAGSPFTITAGPVITSISPTAATAGSSFAVPLTITGTGFTSGSTVTWQGHTATYSIGGSLCSSLTSCTATVPASYLATAGLAPVKVKTADGVASAGMNFSIASATITSFSPTSATVGGTEFTLAVNGTGFAPGATIMWNTTALTTAFVNDKQITGSVPAFLIPLVSAAVPITVVNADGTTTVRSNFTVTAAGAGMIASVSPSSVTAGSPTTTVTVKGSSFIAATGTGTHFAAGSLLYVNGSATGVTVTAGTTSSLTATISSTLLSTAGYLSLTVVNAGTPSAAAPLTVSGPVITATTPGSIAAEAPQTSVIVKGVNFIAGTGTHSFVAGSNVYLNGSGTALVATAGTSTAITVLIPAANLTTPGPLSLTVKNSSGGTVSAPFIIQVGAPTMTSMSATSAFAGSAAFTLTVTGTNFVGGTDASTVMWGATALTTTYVSATAIKAAVTATQLETPGPNIVTVQNGSVVSSGSTFTVNAPAISSLSPASAAPGAAALTLTVNGSSFVKSVSTVYWGSTALTTKFVNATQLTAPLTAPQLASTAVVDVTVQNGSDAISSAAPFGVGLTIESLAPSAAVAGTVTGGATLPLTVNGSNFISGSTVMWGSTALATTYVSAAKLTATITATQLASAGTPSVTVKNSVSLSSAGSTFTVYAPTISSLSSVSAVAGSAPFTLTVTGTNFVAASTVYWGSTALATTVVNATSLTALVTSTQLGVSGAQSVTVQNTATAITSALTFTVGPPTISALSSVSAIAGSVPFTLTVTGTNFVNGFGTQPSTVYWGTTPLTTTYASATSLTAAVTSAQLAVAGPQSVTVQSGPMTDASNASTFTVNAPTISALSSSAAVAGSAPFTLTVTGTNFINSANASKVMWGATALTTTYVSATQVTAPVTSAQLASAGTPSVTVQNGTSTASAGSTFTVSGPTIGSLSATSAASGASAFTLTVTGTNFVSGVGTVPSVVYWDSTALTTTPGSATQITAAVLSGNLTNGTHNVTVQNASAVSPATMFGVGLAIETLVPAAVATGATPFTLTVNGTNFVSGYEVMWNSTALTTTFVSATQLTAAVTSVQLAAAATPAITVQNVGGSTVSAAITFTVGAPTIGSLSPAVASAGLTPFTLTVNGTNFINGANASTVMWGATALTTTYVSATQITAAVTSAQLAAGGGTSVTVANGTATPASLGSTFTVSGPTLATLSVSAAAAGAAPFTLTVTGTNFVSGSNASTVMWGATALTTTYVSATQITAAVTSAQVAAAGTPSVTVVNGSATPASSGSTFTVSAPTIGTLSPSTAAAGSAAFTITVTGTNFVSGANASVVMWGSTALTTTFVSATQITAAVTSTQVTAAGTPSITVVNGSATPASTGSTFTTTAAPTLTLLSPTSKTHGGAAFTLTITGTGFVTGSTVSFGTTTGLVPSAITSTSVTVTVPDTAIATKTVSGHPLEVQVALPLGATTATSSASAFTVN